MTEDVHRQMGMATNNETWRLLDEGGPGPDAPRDERDRFLYRAYASAFHWMEASDTGPANVARAEHLIARAAVGAGMPKRALHHARRCLEIIEQHPDAMEDWDVAFAEEALARAHACAGDGDAAREHRDRARVLGEAIAEADDREVFLTELDREPWFGV